MIGEAKRVATLVAFLIAVGCSGARSDLGVGGSPGAFQTASGAVGGTRVSSGGVGGSTAGIGANGGGTRVSGGVGASAGMVGNTGGAGGLSGTAGAGGRSGAGGMSLSSSPGTVRLELQVPSTTSFCDQVSTCIFFGQSHIGIKDASGNALWLSPSWCDVPCDTCTYVSCFLGILCGGSEGFAVASESLNWDGSYFVKDACGAGQECYARVYAMPGRYVAEMCATPGWLSATSVPEGGVCSFSDPGCTPQCTNTAPEQCVRVEFQFPSSQTYVGKLPG
ncbi:MAG TPA: hypothetical protein VGJ84_01725 [Polyangiaceae bacterium]|jgi:hypothetical protein